MVTDYYKNTISTYLRVGDYKQAFEYLMRILPNLSATELEELSSYYGNLIYLVYSTQRSKL